MTELAHKIAGAIASQPSFPSAYATLHFCAISEQQANGAVISMPLGVFFNERLCLETLAAETPKGKFFRMLCRSGKIRDLSDALASNDLPVYSVSVNALIPVIDFTPGAGKFAIRPLTMVLNEMPTAEQVEALLPLWTADQIPSGGKIIKDREVLKLVVQQMLKGQLTEPMVAVRDALQDRFNSFVLH